MPKLRIFAKGMPSSIVLQSEDLSYPCGPHPDEDIGLQIQIAGMCGYGVWVDKSTFWPGHTIELVEILDDE